MNQARDREFSTGIPALDEVFQGLRPGDNVVWRLDHIEEYIPFVEAFYRDALKRGKKVVYFRFAKHPEVVKPDSGVVIHHLHPAAGFEAFLTEIHRIIEHTGKNNCFIFDSLSDLSDNCYSDRMIGNFFKLTCPYLFRLDTITYFAIYRHYHSYHAASPIADTTQILVDVYNHQDTIYVQPFKVDQRFSPSIFMLHEWREDKFVPVKESAIITEVLASSPWPGLPSASYRMVGVWERMFMRADEMIEEQARGAVPPEKVREVFLQLLKLIISRDEWMLNLAVKYFTLADIVHIWKRMIGTGMIGGKSTGMLLARAILYAGDPQWRTRLEEHDSFFIGSDVFYTFLVENDCWMEKQKQKDPESFLLSAEKVKEKMLKGKFPDYIVRRFADMLDYFGQSPIIVRSSSLLEDNVGNAFAGKYESVFCANQGTHEERLENFLTAVRAVYASTMAPEALNYRKKRGVLDRDEQMALLVQRVSGGPYGRYFFPHLAGVAFSFNSYAWNKQIDPEAGMLRLVFGLGTRAVDRADDDYTRVVALNAPEKRPEADFASVKRYAQRRVDALDLAADKFTNVYFSDIVDSITGLPAAFFATRDRLLDEHARERNERPPSSWILTFDNLLKRTTFIKEMREMLSTVKEAYGSHVDIEFTTNFLSPDIYKINLLQCRPLKVHKTSANFEPLPEIPPENILLKAHGAVIGTTRMMPVGRLIYVAPSVYGALAEKERYAVARIIGELTHADEKQSPNIVLIGPGRWGTGTPALGIPVSFSEIHMASVMCEIDSMHEGLVPDLSLGTHFFNEMVEMDMLYIAYFVGRKENTLNEKMLMQAPNRLLSILPYAGEWEGTVRVIEQIAPNDPRRLYLNADTIEQVAVIYIE